MREHRYGNGVSRTLTEWLPEAWIDYVEGCQCLAWLEALLQLFQDLGSNSACPEFGSLYVFLDLRDVRASESLLLPDCSLALLFVQVCCLLVCEGDDLMAPSARQRVTKRLLVSSQHVHTVR